jgi:hypothetical protein
LFGSFCFEFGSSILFDSEFELGKFLLFSGKLGSSVLFFGDSFGCLLFSSKLGSFLFSGELG